MRMADVFDVTGFAREVERRAGSVGLRVSFSKTCTVPNISGNTITLPVMPAPIDMDAYRFIRGAYIHELAHWFNDRAMALRREYPIDIHSNLGGIWNILEDELDEKLAAKAYPGDGKALGEAHVVILKQTLAIIKKNTASIKKLGDEDVKKIACWLMANHTRDWDPFTPPVIVAMRRSFPVEVTKLCDTLLDEGWAFKIGAMKDADDVLTLAKDLHKRLFPEDEDAQSQLDKAKKDGPPKKGEGQGEGAEGAKPDKGTEKDGIDEKISVVKWEDLVMAQHDHDSTQSKKASFIDWTGKAKESRPFLPATPTQMKVVQIYRNKRVK